MAVTWVGEIASGSSSGAGTSVDVTVPVHVAKSTPTQAVHLLVLCAWSMATLTSPVSDPGSFYAGAVDVDGTNYGGASDGLGAYDSAAHIGPYSCIPENPRYGLLGAGSARYYTPYTLTGFGFVTDPVPPSPGDPGGLSLGGYWILVLFDLQAGDTIHVPMDVPSNYRSAHVFKVLGANARTEDGIGIYPYGPGTSPAMFWGHVENGIEAAVPQGQFTRDPYAFVDPIGPSGLSSGYFVPTAGYMAGGICVPGPHTGSGGGFSVSGLPGSWSLDVDQAVSGDTGMGAGKWSWAHNLNGYEGTYKPQGHIAGITDPGDIGYGFSGFQTHTFYEGLGPPYCPQGLHVNYKS